MTSPTLALAKQLINIPSVTPNDLGCQKILSERLSALGFSITTLPSGNVSNFWATHGDTQKPLFVFSGHTDVVPPGNLSDWRSPPFEATVQNGMLFGRGAADMKTAIASMIIATEQFLGKHPQHKGAIGFLITSDEEGDAIDGTAHVIRHLEKEKIKIDYCLVGEASSQEKLGDSIKIGRRGSLHGALTVFGKQGHIAYPNQAINPIHRSFQALDFLTSIEWDKGDAYFTPTTFQIYNINADTGASNIIPGSLTARFNFRHSPASSAEALMEQTESVLKQYNLTYEINWNPSSQPFLSAQGDLLSACKKAINTQCGIESNANTSGGTSDGRFIAPTGAEVVELGLINESIHQVNEHTDINDMEKLTKLYENILTTLLT